MIIKQISNPFLIIALQLIEQQINYSFQTASFEELKLSFWR